MSDYDFKDQYHSSLGKVIEKAAEKLPKGYVISLQIEEGGWGCELHDPAQYSEEIDGDGVIDSIQRAIDLAVENERTCDSNE